MPFEHAADAEVGDLVLIALDEEGAPWIAGWDGTVGATGPTGPAGGVLSGTYPDPDFAVDMATQAELDSEATARATVASNLATHAALTTTAHGGIVADTDSRLTNARTPTAHASTHASAGSDPITIAESQVTNLTTDLAAKAPLASPAFTGTPTAPTAAADTTTTQVTTTAFVTGQASGSTPTGRLRPWRDRRLQAVRPRRPCPPGRQQPCAPR